MLYLVVDWSLLPYNRSVKFDIFGSAIYLVLLLTLRTRNRRYKSHGIGRVGEVELEWSFRP